MAAEPRLLDLNLLIALAWPQHVHHALAHGWFATLETTWFTTPVTEAGFVRLSTNPVVVSERISAATALDHLRAIRGLPRHAFLTDDASLAVPVIDVSRVVTSAQITDAHQVNLAASAGAVLATLDRGIHEMLAPADRHHALVIEQLE